MADSSDKSQAAGTSQVPTDLINKFNNASLAASKLSDNTPVFCTVEVPADLLTKFFEEAYSASEFEGLDGPIDFGVLVNTEDISSITHSTLPPVPEQSSWPFKGKSAEEIWDFAQQNLKLPVCSGALAIVDDQTLQDKKTCLLVTYWDFPEEHDKRLLTVRSDFTSAIVLLNCKNMACGGDELFETTSPDGIIWHS